MRRWLTLSAKKIGMIGLLVLLVQSPAIEASSAQDATVVERAARNAARKMLGTILVEHQPVFRGGQLSGCTLKFGALAQDWVYKQGAFIKIDGHFGLMSVKNALVVTLKVVLHDFDLRTAKLSPSPPASAYYVFGNRTTKNVVVASEQTDTPGAILVIKKFTPTFKLLSEALFSDKVTIAFARTKDGHDILVPIATDIVETQNDGQRVRSPKPTSDFFECAKTLVDRIPAN